MSFRMTRRELYDLVWSEPMTSAAARLGFSNVGIAKLCRHADIPVPERGYWAKADRIDPVRNGTVVEAVTDIEAECVGLGSA